MSIQEKYLVQWELGWGRGLGRWGRWRGEGGEVGEGVQGGRWGKGEGGRPACFPSGLFVVLGWIFRIQRTQWNS